MDLLAQMATFVRIVDGNSLSAAARAQRMSLPAVSRQLVALEAELGASLIVRSTRRLHVTDAGREWYAHCVRVLREIEEARAAIGDTQTVRGTLVVSASLSYGLARLTSRIARLCDHHPLLGIDLRLDDRLVDVVAEGIDVAVRAGSPPPDSTAFIAYPVMAMQRIVVAAPRWLRKHGTPREPAQLGRHDVLIQVTPAGTRIRWQLERGDDAVTVDVRGRIRSHAPIALRDLAVEGAGIAYLPGWLVDDDLARGRLRRVLPEWSAPMLTAWAVYRAELRGAPRLQAFLAAISDPPPPGRRS